MLEQVGFIDVVIGPAVDTFGGAPGESKARAFEVFGYAFFAHKPFDRPSSDSTLGGN
jgi:arsenite methyltransferase